MSFASTSDDRTCRDCGVAPGRPHVPGCDVARCLATGWQAISCPSGTYREYGDEDGEGPPGDYHDDCGEDVWTGVWPGVEDCRRLGFWTRWVEGQGWERVDASHPEATEDLNRLRAAAVWDPKARRWELPAQHPAEETT